MEFRIAKSEFLRGLRLAQGIADRKSTMPMLANVLLRTTGKNHLRGVSGPSHPAKRARGLGDDVRMVSPQLGLSQTLEVRSPRGASRRSMARSQQADAKRESCRWIAKEISTVCRPFVYLVPLSVFA